MVSTKHGYIMGQELVIDDIAIKAPALSNVYDFIDYALLNKLTHLWVMNDLSIYLSSLNKNDDYDILINARKVKRSDEKVVVGITGRKIKPFRTGNTRVIFYSNTNWNITPSAFPSTVKLIEKELGVPASASPSTVGIRYLELMDNKNYKRYFEKFEEVSYLDMKSLNIPAISFFPNKKSDKVYLHCFDRNSSHPACAVNESFGVGMPRYTEETDFDHLTVGFWNIDIIEFQTDSRLPDLLPEYYDFLPTSIVKILVRAGAKISVKSALLWDKKAPVFERWGKNLWNLRESVHGEERQAIKSIMNNTVGLLRHGDESRESDKVFRPDWYATITGTERAMVWLKCWQIAEKYNLYPVAVYADAIYYASDELEPSLVVPGLLKNALGGYKHVWSLEINNEINSIMISNDLVPAMKISMLKKMKGL